MNTALHLSALCTALYVDYDVCSNPCYTKSKTRIALLYESLICRCHGKLRLL